MAYRDNWKFVYNIDDIKKAALVKQSWHNERFKFWEAKNKDVMDVIRSEGLEISESVAAGYSNSGRNAQVLVRVDLQTDLNECQSKMTEHRHKYTDYQAWVSVFDAQTPT